MTTVKLNVTDKNMQIFDIILMALVVIFVVLRLRGVLGSRDGFDGKPQDKSAKRERHGSDSKNAMDANVIPLPGVKKSAPVQDAPSDKQDEKEDLQFEGALAENIIAVRKADPTFRVDEFLEGAKYAFEMILNAYAEGDVKTLKALLSPDVYGGFASVIEDRQNNDQTLQETLVGISDVQLMEVYLEGHDVNITVKFVSEQISALLDGDGKVIEGDPVKVINATDFWTFSRSTKSRNPNWTLVGTGTLA